MDAHGFPQELWKRQDDYAQTGSDRTINREVSDRPYLVSTITSEVTRLSQVIDKAEDTLASVLEPEYSDNRVGTKEPTPVQSPLRETQQSLSYQIDRLIRLLDRVEA